MKPRPLVMIEWEDACQHDSKDTLDKPLTQAKSYGTLSRKGNTLILYPTNYEESCASQDGPPLCIPKGWVKAIRALTVGRKLRLTEIPHEED